MTKCPHCNKQVDPKHATKIVAYGNGTGRSGSPGYRSQTDQVRYWHPECVAEFERKAAESKAAFLEDTKRQIRDQYELQGLPVPEAFAA
jgi:hypothetical protein